MLKLVTGPTIEPITLAEAKAQCRIEAAMTDEDALITGYIAAARRWCEKIDRRAYLTQTWQLWLDAWPTGNAIQLRLPPLQSVSSIVHYDDADAATTFAASNYYVDTVSEPGRVVLRSAASWPSATLREANGVCVTFVAGWASAASVPAPLKQAVQLVVGYWYENREAAVIGAVSREIELGVRSLLETERMIRH